MSALDPSRPLLLHVGYHKTATTWLQKRVFRRDLGYNKLLNHREIFETLIAPHGLDFDPSPVRALIAERQAAAPEETVADIVSLEALTGLPYDGGRESEAYADRLHAVAPGARILITIREQFTIMASVYMQYLLQAGTAPPVRFFDEAPYQGYTKFTARNFLYHRLVERYQALFGAENVLVLPQEMLSADQAGAVAFLARFSGNSWLAGTGWTPTTDRGVSYPQAGVPLLRRINHIRRGPLNPSPIIDLGESGAKLYRGAGWLVRQLPEGMRRAKPVTEYLNERYAGMFAESNRRLARSLSHPVDLSAYEGMG